VKKVKLTFTQDVKYTREVTVLIPETVDEQAIQNALEAVDRLRDETIDDYIINLETYGFKLDGTIDDDMHNPDSWEIECEDFEVIEEEAEE
jgi:hypothetical protein